MSRRSAQFPDPDPAQYSDEYRSEHSASRQARYPTRLDLAWGRDEYPAQDSGWGQDSAWAQNSGRGTDSGWGQGSACAQDERPGWDQGEASSPRRAARPAWGRDEFAREPPALGRAQRRGEYPTQPDLAWDRDERRGWDRGERSAWDRDERSAWDRDESPRESPAPRRTSRPGLRPAEYPTQPDLAWDRDEQRGWDRDEQRGWDRGERRGWEQDEQRGSPPVEQSASQHAPQSTWRRAGYRKPAQPEVNRPAGPTRHRKPSLVRSVFRRRFVWMTVAVVLAAIAGLVVGQRMHWPDLVNQSAAVNRAATHSGLRSDGGRPAVTRTPASATSSRLRRVSRTGAGGHSQARRRAAGARAGARAGRHEHGILARYGNPVRAITGLLPERIDMGVDFGGSGPIYAIGPGVVVSAMTGDGGWPGGGWMSYRITAGPATGLVVYVAEDITPAVTVGQAVTSKTVIAHMFNGSAGIETGWAQSNGISPESQAPEAGAIWGQGPFPTAIAMNFEELLQALGVPAGYGRDQSTFGTLPTGYPTSW